MGFGVRGEIPMLTSLLLWGIPFHLLVTQQEKRCNVVQVATARLEDDVCYSHSGTDNPTQLPRLSRHR